MKREPIAIVGIGCRLPGAPGVAQFWDMLVAGRQAVREVPADRFNIDALYHPAPATPGRVMSRWGGFLDDIDRFDAQYFGVSPREADRLDPQQRLLLEVTAEALDDAGHPVDRRDGSRTAVFVGMWLNDYESRLFRDPRLIDFYMTTGSGRYSASGRLSYVFGFEGPSITIDCACSSSLAAVHLACQSLRAGESRMAIAGGANVILEPHITIAYSQSRMMAPDGRCKFGDAAADGYVRSEGAAVVVLKPLSAAQADGDPIYALIRGSAVNNDGRSSGFLATPGQAGQETMLRRAYADAGVDPASVQYVEAHGTGTRAGDPVEVGAIGAVLGRGREASAPCHVGSVKTNIGHTEGAAGVTGLIKVALAMKHGVIPPSLHCRELNPEIPWDAIGVTVQREAGAWRTDMPAIAGVSSFGIAGTNAHVVLERYRDVATPSSGDTTPLVMLSAQSAAALSDVARSWQAFASTTDASLADIAYTAAVRRTHYDHRVAVVASTRAELANQLDLVAKGDPSIPAATFVADPSRARKIAFIFPGQGSQWLGMGRQLLEREPAFRQAIDACDAAIRSETGWSVIAELQADPSSSRLDQIDVIQPVLSSVQIALAALWRSWGVEPAAVVGHSMGEVAAACTAGAISIEDAARVICRRSRLLRRTSGQGVMAVIGLSFDKTAQAISGYEDRLSIAVSNSPRSTVISGDVPAVDAVIAALESQDVFCRRVKVDVASHSPQMDPLRDDLFAALQEVAPRPGSVAICSTVLAAITDGAGFDAAYWVRNLRQPVLFSTAVQKLIANGYDTFVEMSPHPLLSSSVQELLQDAGTTGIVVGSLKRDEDEARSIAAAVGALWANGVAVDFSRVFRAGRVVALPSYPWQKQRHWLEVAASRGSFGQSLPLCGRRLTSPVPSYEAEFTAAADAWLSSARIDRTVVVPHAASVAIASSAAADYFKAGAHALSSVRFQSAVRVPDGPVTFHTVLTPRGRDAATFAVHYLAKAEDSDAWQTVVSGEVTRGAALDRAIDVVQVRERCATLQPGADFYAGLAARGIEVREELRAIESVSRAGGECLARLASGIDVAREVAVRQAAFDLIATWDAPSNMVWIAEGIDAVVVAGALDAAAWCHVSVTADDQGHRTASIGWYGEDGRALGTCESVALRAMRPAHYAGSHVARTAGWTYDLAWEPASVDAAAAPALPAGPWVLLGGDGTARALAARLAESGAPAVLVRPGDAFRKHDRGAFTIDPGKPAHFVQLLHEVELETGVAPAGIVHLMALDRQGDAASAIDSRARALTLSAIFAAQAVEQSSSARLWIVTRGAQAIDAHDAAAIDQATCWGAARGFALEIPRAFGGILDLDPADDDGADATAVAAFLASRSGERQVARRGSVHYVPRLVPAAANAVGSLRLQNDGAYLVTGGLGRLGLEIARWLAEKGAGHIVLLGRKGLPAKESWSGLPDGSDAARQVRTIGAIEQLGARVTVVPADTADAPAMRALFSTFGGALPQLRGVVHAAGVIDYRALAAISEADVDAVLRAKLHGTLVLHELTKAFAPALDFFVLFSSGASVWGSRQLAHYGAANSALDAIATVRRAAHLPGLAINWGWWQGGGTSGESEALFAQAGLRPMPAADALEVMGDLIAAGATARTVSAIDWSVFKPAFESVGSSLLARVGSNSPESAVPAGRGVLLAEVTALSADAAKVRVTEFICGQVASVLGRDASQIDTSRGFFKLGMDSLMTVELRRRLEAALDRTLPATIAFEYPTADALAAFLCAGLGTSAAADRQEPATAAAADGVLASLANHTEDELASMLDDELAHLLGEEGRTN